MIRLLFRICYLCIMIGLFAQFRQELHAQLTERLFMAENKADTFFARQLFLEIDNLSFFRNNEYNSTVQKGYTLPGFWLQAKVVYLPLANLKLEAGVHSIWFWGAMRYPAFAYKGISTWKGQDYTNNVHLLPYCRAHLLMSRNVSIVMGNIYGGANHRLIEPLYNPELHLTADPETGVQMLYRSRWLEMDTWVDWMTYIYRMDTHQEAFVTGNSTRFNLNRPETRWHSYFLLQGLAHHRGGEINATSEPVQTLMNGAIGAGVRWNVNRRVLNYINVEINSVGYYLQKGQLWQQTSSLPPNKGSGYFGQIAIQLQDFNIRASYWRCRDFVTILGNPFFGSMSTKEFGMWYDQPKMTQLSVEYVRSLGKGFTFGVHAEIYHFLSGKMYSVISGEYQPTAFGNNQNLAAGIYLRANPSFLLKQF